MKDGRKGSGEGGRKFVKMDGWINEQMIGRINEWMGRWMDGWLDRCMDRWVVG